MTRHYLCLDADVQLQWTLFEVVDSGPIKTIEIPLNLSTPVDGKWPCHIQNGHFFENLIEREPNYYAMKINCQEWQAWSLSKKEFDTAVKLCELWPIVTSYYRLLNGR